MAQFRQIIMPWGNHSDRLRSTLIKGKKRTRDQGEQEQSDSGMSLSFCLPTHFPKLVKVPDSIH